MPPTITPALVLRVVDYGESDRIVTFYTRDLGKLGALARGARRSRRRFGPGLRLFALGEATLVERRGAELARLDGFVVEQSFSPLSADLARLTHASYAVELLRELCPPRQPDPAVFALGAAFLETLSASEARPELLRAFELGLLGELGLAPACDRCAACGGGDLDHPGQVFDLRRGGVVCRDCRRTESGAGVVIPLPPSARRAFSIVQGLDPPAAAGIALSAEDNAVLRDITLAVIRDHLGKPLRSLEFLGKLQAARRNE